MPPLSEVPRGEWYCDNCKAKGFDVTDGKGRGGGRGKGSQDGGGGGRGAKPTTLKSAPAAAMIATRVSPRAAAAAAAAAAATLKEGSPPGKGGLRSPTKVGQVAGFVAEAKATLAATAKAASGVDGDAASAATQSAPPPDERQGTQAGEDPASLQPRSIRPGKGAAPAAQGKGTVWVHDTDQTTPVKPRMGRPPLSAGRTGRGWSGEAPARSRCAQPPLGNNGRGGRASRGGSGPSVSSSESSDSPAKARMGRPPTSQGARGSRLGGLGGGGKGRGVDDAGDGTADGGNSRGADGIGDSAQTEAEVPTAPEEGRRKKKRTEHVAALFPPVTAGTTAAVAATPSSAAMDSYSTCSSSSLSSASSNPLFPSAAGAPIASILPVEPLNTATSQTEGGEGSCGATDTASTTDSTLSDVRENTPRRRSKKRVHADENVDEAGVESTQQKQSTPVSAAAAPAPGGGGIESPAQADGEPTPNVKKSHHKKKVQPGEEVVDGRKAKRRRESAPAAMAAPEGGAGGSGGTDASATGRAGQGRGASVARGGSCGRGKGRGRGGRSSASGPLKATVENDYSRPRLHHRAPGPSLPPMTTVRGRGRSRGPPGGNVVAAAVDAPVRRSKRKVRAMSARVCAREECLQRGQKNGRRSPPHSTVLCSSPELPPAPSPPVRRLFFTLNLVILVLRCVCEITTPKVESTHATQYSESEVPSEQQPTKKAQSRVCLGSNGNVVVGAEVTDDGDPRGAENVPVRSSDLEKGVVKVPHMRRKSTGADGGRKAGKQRSVGYPMTAVSAVLRQLHMRVLSGDEMSMLDKVRTPLVFCCCCQVTRCAWWWPCPLWRVCFSTTAAVLSAAQLFFAIVCAVDTLCRLLGHDFGTC